MTLGSRTLCAPSSRAAWITAEDRREIEFLSGRPVRDTAAACVKAFGGAPVFVQRFCDLLRRGPAGLCPRGFVRAGFLHPLSAIGERRVVHKPCVIMVAQLFLPNVETGLAPMPDDKPEIGQDKRAHGRAGLAIEAIERPKAHQGESPRGWAIVLRARPFGDVERPVRVEPRLAKNTIPGDPQKIAIVRARTAKRKDRYFS